MNVSCIIKVLWYIMMMGKKNNIYVCARKSSDLLNE